MSYPYNSDEALQLGKYSQLRGVVLGMMVVSFVFTFVLAYALRNEIAINFRSVSGFILLLALQIALYAVVIVCFREVDLYRLHGMYDRKAEYELHLYKLLEKIVADNTITDDAKHRLLAAHLLHIQRTDGHERHLEHIPSKQVRAELLDVLKEMKRAEGQKITDQIEANGGIPGGGRLSDSSHYCSRLEEMETALKKN